MAKTELTSLQKRILTSLIMIPIVIGALQSGHPYVDILVFIVGAMLSWEWASMVSNKKSSVYAVCYTFAMGCSLLVFNRWVLIATIALTTLFVFIKAKEEQHRKLLTLGVLSASAPCTGYITCLTLSAVSPEKKEALS